MVQIKVEKKSVYLGLYQEEEAADCATGGRHGSAATPIENPTAWGVATTSGTGWNIYIYIYIH